MTKLGLTDADKQWIADLIKPISEDVKALKDDMVEVKTRLKAIEECPTIKKELNKK